MNQYVHPFRATGKKGDIFRGNTQQLTGFGLTAAHGIVHSFSADFPEGLVRKESVDGFPMRFQNRGLTPGAQMDNIFESDKLAFRNQSPVCIINWILFHDFILFIEGILFRPVKICRNLFS